MFVKGSPSAARELSEDLKNQVRRLTTEIGDLNNALKALGGTYQDQGYEERSQTVRRVAQTTMDAMEPVSSVCKCLNAYAEILERS